MAIDVEFTTPPTAPSSTDADTFRTRADAFVAWIVAFVANLAAFVTQINSTVENINAKEASAVAAALATATSANFKGTFVQGISSALVSESWNYGGIIYRCLVNTSNNPSSEPASWVSLSFGDQIHNSPSKATPIDADEFGFWDSASGLLRKVSFANLKLSLWAPAGHIAYFAMQTAPSGYLKANGAAISRTTYSALFTAIGTTFGAGDGSTTFNIPDLRGEFIRSFDDARGIDSGRVFGSYQTDDIKPHAHQYDYRSTEANTVGGVGGGPGAGVGINLQNTTSAGNSETRPRNIALLACIKY